jgi:hypothetical protein
MLPMAILIGSPAGYSKTNRPSDGLRSFLPPATPPPEGGVLFGFRIGNAKPDHVSRLPLAYSSGAVCGCLILSSRRQQVC